MPPIQFLLFYFLPLQRIFISAADTKTIIDRSIGDEISLKVILFCKMLMEEQNKGLY